MFDVGRSFFRFMVFLIGAGAPHSERYDRLLVDGIVASRFEMGFSVLCWVASPSPEVGQGGALN